MARRQQYASFFFCWFFLTFSTLGCAQSDVAEKGEPQPMKVASIILHYSSVFDRYHRYDDIQGGSWRDANDAVGPSDVRRSPADEMKQINDAPGIEQHDMSMQSTSVKDPAPEQKSSNRAEINQPGVKP